MCLEELLPVLIRAEVAGSSVEVNTESRVNQPSTHPHAANTTNTVKSIGHVSLPLALAAAARCALRACILPGSAARSALPAQHNLNIGAGVSVAFELAEQHTPRLDARSVSRMPVTQRTQGLGRVQQLKQQGPQQLQDAPPAAALQQRRSRSLQGLWSEPEAHPPLLASQAAAPLPRRTRRVRWCWWSARRLPRQWRGDGPSAQRAAGRPQQRHPAPQPQHQQAHSPAWTSTRCSACQAPRPARCSGAARGVVGARGRAPTRPRTVECTASRVLAPGAGRFPSRWETVSWSTCSSRSACPWRARCAADERGQDGGASSITRHARSLTGTLTHWRVHERPPPPPHPSPITLCAAPHHG